MKDETVLSAELGRRHWGNGNLEYQTIHLCQITKLESRLCGLRIHLHDLVFFLLFFR